jgi:hypothetical protein
LIQLQLLLLLQASCCKSLQLATANEGGLRESKPVIVRKSTDLRTVDEFEAKVGIFMIHLHMIV